MNNNLIKIKHPEFKAFILKQGAQLIHFQPTGSPPLLWSAQLSTFQRKRAFRGGIPICWPWFGKVQSPAHGFARISDWTLQSIVENEASVALVFTLQENTETLALWPHKFTLRLEMTLQKNGVQIELYINTTVQTTGALHTYLWVDEIENVVVNGLGDLYWDALDSTVKFDKNNITIAQEVDRIYTSPSKNTVISENNCLIMIKHLNASDVVLWNPWKAASEKLFDMNREDYRHMLCVETARVNTTFDHKEMIGCEIEITNL